MQIITLITDFGTKGYRAGSLKGSLLSVDQALNIIDISHDVAPFEIDEAAFILRSTYRNFPENTIHIVNVLNYYETTNRILYFRHEGQYFVGPDNGIFSLVFDNLTAEIFTLNEGELSDTHYTNSYTYIVGKLSSGADSDSFGMKIDDMKYKLILQPVTAKNEIRGAVIFIDRYGNITVNIRKEVFEKIRDGRSFSLFLNRHDHIRTLSDHYMQVDIGSPLCNFNSQGFLEIAVNLQRADELLGIKKGDVIQIKFQD